MKAEEGKEVEIREEMVKEVAAPVERPTEEIKEVGTAHRTKQLFKDEEKLACSRSYS